jgi:hypothetical protein
MTYVLRSDGSQKSTESFVEAWRRYREYLATVADQLPRCAREFALAEWHYNYQDSRAPHDAWVESLAVYETATGVRQEIRQAHIKLRLLGAYHDGHIEIEYLNVKRYSIGCEFPAHGDWEQDEIRLSDEKGVIHEIEIGGTNWLIECEDIRYLWLPTAQLDTSTATPTK